MNNNRTFERLHYRNPRLLPPAGALEEWHLFLVKDDSKTMLISAQSASVSKAEELVTAVAGDECDMNPMFIGARYLGVAVDGDICEEI